MNTPPLLLGAAILFWGWHTGHWAVAAPCALAFEAARFVPRRWEFTTERLNHISDFCSVLAVLLGIYLYFTQGNPRAVIQFFYWLPLVLLPLALSQAYGAHRDIDLGVLFLSVRRARRRRPMRFNIGYAYFAAWIIAASAANQRDASFEIGLIALAAWALWQVRPRSRPLALWLTLVPLAGAIGFAGHNGLHSLQLWLEGNAPGWLAGEGGSNTNPYRADTDIGHIGELKQSDRIVLRVRPGARLESPLLLHRASYDEYTGLRWLARGARFVSVAQEGGAGSWPLMAQAEKGMQSVSIVEQTTHANPVLGLPAGTRRIEGLAASDMKRNTLGAVQIEHRPGFVPYRVLFAPGSAQAAPPGAEDLALPRREAEALARIAGELGVKRMAAREAIAAIERYFAENFRYSTYQSQEQGRGSPIADFLERTRAGHCEYFASATVLLLRAAGIPARYATGFSVQEWSDLESAYVVRERHAHAWVRVWSEGAWRDLDTTPAMWALAEAGASPWWSRAADAWSWLRLKFSELQSGGGETPLVWIVIAAAVMVWIGWRLFGRPAQAARAAPVAEQASFASPGMDSAFYRVEAHLGRLGWERARGETMREWLARIGPHLAHLPRQDELAELMALHYRCRFDPRGLPPEESARFAARVDAWLAQAR